MPLPSPVACTHVIQPLLTALNSRHQLWAAGRCLEMASNPVGPGEQRMPCQVVVGHRHLALPRHIISASKGTHKTMLQIDGAVSPNTASTKGFWQGPVVPSGDPESGDTTSQPTGGQRHCHFHVVPALGADITCEMKSLVISLLCRRE